MSIIESMLDQDLYKLTMMQFVLHQCPNVHVKYKFKCRNSGINLAQIMPKLQDSVNWMSRVRLTDTEAMYMRSLGFFKDDFIQLLKQFRFNPNYVSICSISDRVGSVPEELEVIVEGPWYQTILYEVPLLSTINELYFGETHPMTMGLEQEGIDRLSRKVELIDGTKIRFADFGTRRRYSKSWQDTVIRMLVSGKCGNFVGTSNVHLARKYNVRPIGTMAHEIFQVCQALTRIEDSQKFALQKWADEYRGELGIALTDNLGIDKFLKDFDKYFAKLFDGVRHDSGSPYEWVDKVVKHYYSLGIDPESKIAVFSDGLTFEEMLKIKKYVGYQMRVSFGIGTNLTNDLGPEPLNIVMKVVEANGQPVAKISDSPGKEMCEDGNYVNYLKSLI